MNEQTPWFMRQNTVKVLTLLSWITHIVSMVAIFKFMPIWVPIICIVIYIFLEKYLGYFVDIFAFIVSIVYSGGWLIAILALGIIYPWVLNYALRKCIANSIGNASQTEHAFKNEFTKFQNDTLMVIGAAWKNTAYYSAFKTNEEKLSQYLREIFEAQRSNFEYSSKEKIEALLSLVFIQTFTCSYYVLLNLREYFPEHNVNRVVLEMMEVLGEMDVFSLELSDAAQEMIKNKKNIVSETLERLLLG